MKGEEIKRLFVDTGAWIALLSKNDVHHKSAAAGWSGFLRGYGRLVTTNLVISETYTFLRSEVGFKPAWDFLERTAQTPRLDIVQADDLLETEGRALLAKYREHGFSYADAVSFAVMGEFGIDEAFAFDRHFLIAGFKIIPTGAS